LLLLHCCCLFAQVDLSQQGMEAHPELGSMFLTGAKIVTTDLVNAEHDALACTIQRARPDGCYDLLVHGGAFDTCIIQVRWTIRASVWSNTCIPMPDDGGALAPYSSHTVVVG
jgi:hypothetical protein